MGLSSEEKVNIVDGFLDKIERRFEISTMKNHAKEFAVKTATSAAEQGVGTGEPSHT